MEKSEKRRRRRKPVRVPGTIFLSGDGRKISVLIRVKRGSKWDFLKTAGVEKRAAKDIDDLDLDLDRLPSWSETDAALTERERVVLAQIVKGASSKTVARALEISPRTVEYHRANAMQKLGAKNTAELVRIVLRGR